MTVKVGNGRYLNLELEKKYKEKEEKLLEQAKCKLKQLKSSKFQNNLDQRKNLNKRPDNLKSNCGRVQGLNNKCKLITSLPSPEVENTRIVNGVSNRTNLINNNIVLDSDSGVSSSVDKSCSKKNDNLNQLQELNRPSCENSYFCCDNSVCKRCGCFNYTALFANLTNNDSLELFRSFKMIIPSETIIKHETFGAEVTRFLSVTDGSLEYEQKLHEKIRILEQQEKILNNRLISPKTINSTRFTTEDGRPINSIHNYSGNQIKKESLVNGRENKSSSSKSDDIIASNLSTNSNSTKKNKGSASNKFADDLFITKVTERIVNNIKKDIFHVGSVEKQSKILQTDQPVEFKSPPPVETKSEMCQTSAIMISSARTPSEISNLSSARSSKCSHENPKGSVIDNAVLSNKGEYKSERNSKQLQVEYEDKAVNTDRQYIQQRHTRHKMTCKRACKREERRKSPHREYATGVVISNSCSSESNNEDRPVSSEHHYKAIQVVVNVHADRGKMVKRKSSSYVTEIPTRGTASNWRKLLNEAEDKLTESSYYSPPDMVGCSRLKRISFPDDHDDDKAAIAEPVKRPERKKKIPSKIDDETLRMYVEKVLSMRRESIDKLDVSSCSTPSEISLIFDGNKDDYRLTERRALGGSEIIDRSSGYIDNENVQHRRKCSGASTEIRGRSNSVPAAAKENVQYRQTSQPEMKLPSRLSDDRRLTDRNKHSAIPVSDDEMNKQLSNLNLSMTDFEQNLKALCNEFDEKLTQFVDDEGKGSFPSGRNRLEQSDAITSTNDLNLHTRLHRLLRIPLDDSAALKMINSDDESDKISLERSSSLDELPSMSDLMKIGLIDKPFKYALDDVTMPSDTDIKKLLEIDSCYSKENNASINNNSTNNNDNNNDNSNNNNSNNNNNNNNNKMTDALNSDRSKATAIDSDKVGRDLLTLLSPTTATADLEQIIRQLGLSWMSTTLQKTKEASALVSSSSGGENTNQNYHLENVANILLMNDNFKQGAELEQFAPVTAFFKNDEKLVSPIGNKPVKQHQVSTISSSS